MNIYVIDAVRVENGQVQRVKGYLSSVNLSLFFPPSQYSFEFSRIEIINLIRQGNIFDVIVREQKIPLHLNIAKNTVSLEIAQFENLDKF